MNKQLSKVIGTFGGAMAVTVLLAVPTYAGTSTQQVTKVNNKVYLATYNTPNQKATTDIVTATSPWDTIVAANVTNYAHIRESGSLESEIVGVLYRGSTGIIIEKGLEWTKIKSGEVTGYIRNDLFVTKEEAKKIYEETFDIADADPTNLEHQALTIAQWNERLEAEKAAAAEKAKEEAQSVNVGSGELDLLAAIIQCEAGGESYEGKIAVGAVIMNRVNSGKFPDSITDVVYQGGQFSPVSSGILSRTLSQGARNDCYAAAQDVLNGANNVGGCLYFNSGSGKGIQIGNQHFY